MLEFWVGQSEFRKLKKFLQIQVSILSSSIVLYYFMVLHLYNLFIIKTTINITLYNVVFVRIADTEVSSIFFGSKRLYMLKLVFENSMF